MMSKLKKLFLKYQEVIMYIIMGGCTTVVYYIARFGSRLLLENVGSGAMIATAIAQITAITFAFITNKKFVFKSKTDSVKALAKEAVAFYAGRGVTFLLDMLITFIFVESFANTFINLFGLEKINYSSSFMSISLVHKLMGTPQKMNEFIWSMLSQVIILVLNYVFSKLFVFKKDSGEKNA